MISSLDNIPEDVLDLIKTKFSNNSEYRITDDRASLSFGKPREYFLFGGNEYNSFTYIWINNNLWQYTYVNVYCKDKANWEDPLKFLNNLIDGKK